MSESAIRQQIYTVLSGITDIGEVYDYERWANDWATFIGLFKTQIGGVDQIRGWEINRKAVGAKPVSFETVQSVHSFVIKGYMGLKDAVETEKTFNTLVETIRTTFRENATVRAAADDYGEVQAEVIEPRMFGSVLCHYAELTIEVSEQNSVEI